MLQPASTHVRIPFFFFIVWPWGERGRDERLLLPAIRVVWGDSKQRVAVQRPVRGLSPQSRCLIKDGFSLQVSFRISSLDAWRPVIKRVLSEQTQTNGHGLYPQPSPCGSSQPASRIISQTSSYDSRPPIAAWSSIVEWSSSSSATRVSCPVLPVLVFVVSELVQAARALEESPHLFEDLRRTAAARARRASKPHLKPIGAAKDSPGWKQARHENSLQDTPPPRWSGTMMVGPTGKRDSRHGEAEHVGCIFLAVGTLSPHRRLPLGRWRPSWERSCPWRSCAGAARRGRRSRWCPGPASSRRRTSPARRPPRRTWASLQSRLRSAKAASFPSGGRKEEGRKQFFASSLELNMHACPVAKSQQSTSVEYLRGYPRLSGAVRVLGSPGVLVVVRQGWRRLRQNPEERSREAARSQ